MSYNKCGSDTEYRYVGDTQTRPTVREMKRVRLPDPTEAPKSSRSTQQEKK